MNLLSILLKSLLSSGTLNALAKKTGLNAKQLKKLLPLAVPLLLKMLTKNASGTEGAASLLSALTQHTSKETMEQQIAKADTKDGEKIIGHILGAGKESDIISLSNQTGLSQQQVSGVLSGIAPALLSGLSAATSTGSTAGKVDLSDGLDLSDVMAMLGGSKPQSGGLLSSLFAPKPVQAEKDDAVNGSTLLQLLLANK
jgi:hypothetical protein